MSNVDNFEDFEKLQEKLSTDVDWAKIDSGVKNELLNSIHKELAESLVEKYIDELKPKPEPKKRGRKPKKLESSTE